MQTKPTWDISKRQQLSYARREPNDSVLYRVVYHLHQELEYVWEERYQQHYGALRQEVLDAYDAYLNCGLLIHGCARAVCEDCGHSELIALSCKERICPSCTVKRGHIFAQHLEDNLLLPYPHGHLVATMAKRVRAFFRYDRKLYKHLYQSTWQAWVEYVGAELPDCHTGAVMALHTTGDLLDHHPHPHAIVLYGGVDGEGQFHALEEPIDTDYLERLFREKLFYALLHEELLTQADIDCMNSWENSGFSVFVGPAVAAGDSDARLFLARYLKKAPLALERLELLEDNDAHIVRLHSSLEDDTQYRDFTPLDFLAELSLAIPDHREQTTRYYGVYSHRTRGAKRREEFLKERQARKETGQDITELNFELPPRPSTAWLTWIKKVYLVDPLTCKKCGGRMNIKAFILSQSEIERICQNLKIVSWRAPPPLNGQTELSTAA